MLALVLVIIAVLGVATAAALYYSQKASDAAALNLQVSVSPVVGSGQVLTANLWINNTLSTNNSVTVASDWPLQGLTSGCITGYPLRVGLLTGHYAANNVSDGQLVPYPFVFGCPGVQIILQSLTFLPHSSTAVAKTNFGTPTWDINSTFTYQNLSAGEYTVVAGDEWGQIAFAYFSVTA